MVADGRRLDSDSLRHKFRCPAKGWKDSTAEGAHRRRRLQSQLKSDGELSCVVPPGPGGSVVVQVIVGIGATKVESHRSHNQFRYVLSPKEKIQQESSMLLDGLSVRHPSLPVFLNKGAITGHHEVIGKDSFSGKTIAFSVPPDLMDLIPDGDLKMKHAACSVVLNSANLREKNYGADIDSANAVFRFNNAPTEGFRSEVGRRTNYRFVQVPLIRSMVQKKDLQAARRAWRPVKGEKLITLSDLAQDLVTPLSKALPRGALLFPSAPLLQNVHTMYAELRRRFEDLGISGDLDSVDGGGAEDAAGRRLLGAPISLAQLARTAIQEHELLETEPATGLLQPPQALVAVFVAVQMCERVTLYGHDGTFGAGPSTRRHQQPTYYGSDPVGLDVFDITTTRPEKIEGDAALFDNAVLELLQVLGHLKIQG
uniref:Uncharacterized protein n=1 Tax=Tetraselmis sp. GSL018 TaxID=582737 RepID=A0A061QYS5_9CHLO